MRKSRWRPDLRSVLMTVLTALIMFPLGFMSAACCGPRCRGGIPPNMVCTERPPPTDPLEGSTVDDGFTAEQRTAFIRHAVASTVDVGVARYTEAEGVRNYGGTGIVIGADRTILTAAHVIKDAEFITITYRSVGEDGLTVTGGRTIPVRLIAVAETQDVAILRPVRADEPGFPAPLPVDASWRPVESTLLWQFGKTSRWGRGHILDPDAESADIEHVVEVAFTVRPGDSGGPAMTPDGRVIGVILSRHDGSADTTTDDKGYFMPMHLALEALHYRP